MKPLNKYFDHTLLKASATPEDIRALCEQAITYDFCSVCVNSCYVAMAASILGDTDVKVATVVGFPLGAMSTDAKCDEASYACTDGADEIDMVINIGMLKAGEYDYVKNDIAEVVEAVHDFGGLVKVIIETCLLDDEEKRMACKLAIDAGADFVKTSTGFSTGGATSDDVALMKLCVNGKAQVKASGGIHSLADARAMIEAGADRIGASASVAIMEEYKQFL